MKKSYRYAVVYFTLFSALLLLSGTWLFVAKIGLTPESVSAYYLGDAALYTQPKSLHGLLEVALPHLGSMGLFIMVAGHLLIFTPVRQRRSAALLVLALFAAVLADILSPFGITAGIGLFVWVKLLAFALLELLGLVLLWFLFSTTVSGILGDRMHAERVPPHTSKPTKGTP